MPYAFDRVKKVFKNVFECLNGNESTAFAVKTKKDTKAEVTRDTAD